MRDTAIKMARALIASSRQPQSQPMNQEQWGILDSALREAEVKIEDYLGTLSVLSHDLKNPVNVILMAASAIERTSCEESTATRARRIGRAARWIDRLIQDYLLTGVIDSGVFRVIVETLELDEVVATTVEWMAEAASAAGVRVIFEPRCGKRVIGDRARLRQAVMNLLDNAVKHSPQGTTVLVRTECMDGLIRLSVEDQGNGVSETVRKTIFERFCKGADLRKAGSGLGLYITRSIVEAHGGRIWLESRAGGGSAFRFTLQVA